MKTIWLAALVALMTGTAAAEEPADYPLVPVPFSDVRISDRFWAPRLETNRVVSIPYAFEQCAENGRMDNFAIAAGLREGEHRGRFPFDDTDPYKILEGASYSLSVHPDPALENYLDDLIVLIAGAQEEDGYLYTCRTNGAEALRNWFGEQRFEKLAGSHELYNAGHLYEAAVAHFRATGKRTLLDVAMKNADLIDRVFGPEGIRAPPGHQVIEMGLARLYRATGVERYLELAEFLLDERGRARDRELYGPYSQDHEPVTEQSEAVGHAVRATYMYAGMADVAALSGNQEYVAAIDRIWENVVSRKLHITGGVGARASGEAFGDDYELPNMTAYNETCAAIGNVMWNHRMFLLHADARYIDVLERTLYNGALSGVSLSGDRFFYQNPLESRGQHERSPWFGCACCPGNVTRFIPSIPGYAYATKGDVLYVNLFAEGAAEVRMAAGGVGVRQGTMYPWDGRIRIEVRPENSGEFALHVRIPGWARNEPVPSDLYRFATQSDEEIVLRVNGQPWKIEIDHGFVPIRRVWKEGDVVDLVLPMPIRRVLCHDNVEENRGRVALQRGPLVYCLEWPDNENGRVLNLLLPDAAPLFAAFRADLLGGVTTIYGEALALLFGSDGVTVDTVEQPFVAIPYAAWAHRGKGEMTVWPARDRAFARPLPASTVASTAKLTTSGGTNPSAINDQVEPSHSNDHSVVFFHWWPKKGTTEWAQLDFEEAVTVSRVDVYWFDDTGRGECRVPSSWRLLFREGEKWLSVTNAGAFGVEKDRFVTVTFDAIETDGLKLEVQLQGGFSAGIHEWQVR